MRSNGRAFKPHSCNSRVLDKRRSQLQLGGPLSRLRRIRMTSFSGFAPNSASVQDLRLSSGRVRRLFRMSEHIYKKLELVGSSKKSIEDAVQNALARASKTIRNMRWFEVTETRGHIEKNKIDHWQV